MLVRPPRADTAGANPIGSPTTTAIAEMTRSHSHLRFGGKFAKAAGNRRRHASLSVRAEVRVDRARQRSDRNCKAARKHELGVGRGSGIRTRVPLLPKIVAYLVLPVKHSVLLPLRCRDSCVLRSRVSAA